MKLGAVRKGSHANARAEVPVTIYNEIDPYAAKWIGNLVAVGHVAPGVVDPDLEAALKAVGYQHCPDCLTALGGDENVTREAEQAYRARLLQVAEKALCHRKKAEVDGAACISVDDDGAFNVEWCADDCTISFWWHPKEGAMATRTTGTDQSSDQTETAGMSLARWLNERKAR